MNVFLGGNIEDVQDNVNIYLTLTNISKYKNINNMYSSFLQEFLDAEKSSEIDIFGVNQPKVEALDVEEKEEIEETPDLEEINFEEEEDVDDFQEEEEVEIEEPFEEGYDDDDWVDYGESKEDEWVGEEETEEKQDEEEFVDSADWEDSDDEEDDEWENEEESEVVEDDNEWVSVDEEEVADEQVEEIKESEEVEFEDSSDEILGDQDLSKVAKQEESQIEEKQYLPPLREYVKKNPKVTKSEVIKLYGSKELTKMLKLGKVYERKGRLFI